MASSARIDEIKKKFDENPRRYFAPLANEFRKAGDLEQAILICEEFLPQQAGHMSGHIVYGQALFEAGRLPESRTVFETALGLDPENLIALRHLGDIALAQGEPGEARRWYDRVLEADPRNEEIQTLLAGLAGGAPGAEEPAATESFEAQTLVFEEELPAPAAPAAPAAPPSMPAPQDLAPVDLDMDESMFAPPAAAPPPAAPPAAAAPANSAFDAISLEGLEPTNAEAATAAGMPVTGHGRAEGLVSAEFEVPVERHVRAEGLEPAEFEAPSTPPPRAEGLETAEFQAPAPSTDRSLLDLESSFAAEVGAHPARSASGALPGLEETAVSHPPAADEPRLPSLDLDQGLAVPRRDDVAAGAPAPVIADVPLGEAAGRGAENPRLEPPAAMEAMPALEMGSDLLEEAPAPMMELPPSVIAAESALMDAGETVDEFSGGGSAAAGGSAPPPFVTETMAELYEKQGFHVQALDVYRQLSAASPDDARLRDRVASLERQLAEPAVGVVTGQTVREFLFRLATRQPGQRAAEGEAPSSGDFAGFEAPVAEPIAPARAPESVSDFTSFEAIPEAPIEAFRVPAPEESGADEPEADEPAGQELEMLYVPEPDSAPAAESEFESVPAPEPEPEPEPQPVARSEPVDGRVEAPAMMPAPMPTPAERASAAQGNATTSGSIDALFGSRTASTSEDSAASALAQAFGGTAESPVITGRPARAASAELSLDSVFRDAPPRPPRVSQSFSFDQFFSESASSEGGAAAAGTESPASGEPAERSADDVKQFNSWLQGLKPR